MHVAIIGNGISGITAARWVRKLSDHKITVISSESKHFYSRTALMYIYMGHMRYEDTKPYEDWFWEKNRIDLVQDHVNAIDFSSKTLSLNQSEIKYDKLILALGSKSNKFGWPGQDLNGVRGLYSLQDLEHMEKYTPDLKRAVVVGGGLIGIEMAEMFHSRKIPVTMVVRENSYWDNILPPEESAMVTNHIKRHHFDLRIAKNLGEILDNGHGSVGGITIKETGEKIECEFVGLTPGVSPNVGWLKESALNVERGIVVNKHLETNIEGVYAIGDCAQLAEPVEGRRPIEAVWYTGRMMGETVAYNICKEPKAYDPGIWFNSAKFIDIEYQVYGDVRNHIPEDQSTLYWEHSDGEKAVRINYLKKTGGVTGFNLMGVRYRHEVCEKWLREKTNIEEVLQNLSLANFDPEFFKEYEQDILNLYNKKEQKNLKLKSKRSLNSVIKFLTSKSN